MATAIRKSRAKKAEPVEAVAETAAAPQPTAAEPVPAPEPAAAAMTYDPPPYTASATTSPGSSGGLLARLNVGEMTAEQRDRQAALDWERVIAPAMDLMRASVPDASTPEEAARILSENQGEITPDPRGGAYIQGDSYQRDARVYYRLLRRDYEKVPRPSEAGKWSTSHHLHQLHGKLTGTKGW